ncbi:MAG: phospholipid carrier-dependent glycosyltransferase [Chloroflexi bacterium]|nr:phospholipid carrier-dependent glycosyltransferase [Chloroflexota bacterium]
MVTLGAAAVRLAGLTTPAGLVFDEIFYARNACRFVIDTAQCGINDLVSGAHPPLGNWLIGTGIRLFGYDEFGWRIASAVAGTLGAVLLYVLVRRLLAGQLSATAATVGAATAAGLLATDFLDLVQSRVAMLDSFVTMLVIAVVLFVVLDSARRRGPRGEDLDAPAWLRRLSIGRPWRLAASLALGSAVAVKWSGGYVAFGLIALLVAREIAASASRPGDDSPIGWRAAVADAFRREIVPSLVLLGVVPLVVYLASYAGRVEGDLLALPWREGSVWRGILEHQLAMLRFHLGLAGNHPYESAAWSWIVLKRPVAYSFASSAGAYREVLAIGNPLTWWPGAFALGVAAVRWVRSGGSLARPEVVLLLAALSTYLPWLVLSGSRSQVFIWYLLPTIPFLYAALGLWAALAWGSLPGRVAIGLAAFAVAVSFAFFYPILTAAPLTPDEWRSHIWFADCRRPGAPTLVVPDDEINRGPPPAGWCWI